jgi:predicted nucleic acid-binding protein
LNKPFIDSNVVLYLLSGDANKADKAESLLEAGGVISVQVLNEVVSVCQRKLKLSWGEIDAILQALKASVEIVPLTQATHELAVQLCKRYQLSFYDAHICSAALLAGSTIVLSEDMQDGMLVDSLVIKNPFKMRYSL